MPAPIIVTPTSVPNGVGPTRAQYRRALGAELGEFAVLTTTAEADPSVSVDADRQVLIEALGVDGVSTNRFDGGFIYVVDGPEAGEVRGILAGTFDGPIQSLLLDKPFSSGPLGSGVEVELSKPLPGNQYLTSRGLNQIVDVALGLIDVTVVLSITGDDTRTIDLSAYPWLVDEEQIIGIADTSRFGTSEPPERSPGRFRMVNDYAAHSLVTEYTYAATETATLWVIGPADHLVFNGTSWAYQDTPGLLSDTYQGIPPVSWVVAFGMVKALQQIEREMIFAMDPGVPEARQQLMLASNRDRRLHWGRVATSIKRTRFPQPLVQPARAMVGGTHRVHNAAWPTALDGWRE